MSNFLSNPNIKRGVKAIALTAALSLGSAACSDETERVRPTTQGTKMAEPTSTFPVKPEISAPLPEEPIPNTIPPLELDGSAEKYVTSPERNQEIDAKVQDAGARVVAAAESGVMGPFDFYNFQTKDWGRGVGNEGWGMLQHNPQYGGSEDQVAVFVYQDAMGNVDLTKGVKSLMFRDPNGSVEFTAPGGIFSAYDPEGPHVHENSWMVRVATQEDIAAGDNVGTESSEFTVSVNDATTTDIKLNDNLGQAHLSLFLLDHGL